MFLNNLNLSNFNAYILEILIVLRYLPIRLKYLIRMRKNNAKIGVTKLSKKE